LHQYLKEYLAVHGYWVLFIWTFLEGEAGLILAGFLAFDGYLNLVGVVLTAFSGAFCGDQFYFYLGRWQGSRLLQLFTLLARRFHKALRLIEKYGTLVAFTSRYTYGFRIILPVVLGMTTFSGGKFCRINILSALTWAIIFSLAGYLFGVGAAMFVEDVGRYEQYLVVILACCIAAVWSFHLTYSWRRRSFARKRLKRMRMRRMDR
jgi:membrane protein DedA with SNARE-associated domain